jgi:putative endonuclease
MPSSELSAVFCYVYVLSSFKGDHLYIGFTQDLQKRITEHNKGLNRSTKAYVPWRLVYYEVHRNELDGLRREKYLKTTAGNKALKNMLREELKSSRDLSRQKVYS